MAIVWEQALVNSHVSKIEPINHKLHLPTVKVISYSGPGESSSVTASLESAVLKLNAKVHWLALSGIPESEVNGSADRLSSSENKNFGGVSFKKLKLPQLLIEQYDRFCFEYLWPLFHGKTKIAKFNINGWHAFNQLSGLIAAESLSTASKSYPTLNWLHDYQMAQVAPLVSMDAGSIACHFWHISWPEPEIIAQSPIGREIVESLLANKVIGFHVSQSANNFLKTVKQLIPDALIDMEKMEIKRQYTTTHVVVIPVGLDFLHWTNLAKNNQAQASLLPKKYKLANQLMLGIDRLDYSKGILEKLNGLELFLQNNIDWHRRFHYVQLTQKALLSLPDFKEYEKQVTEKISAINKQYGVDGWQPILWIQEQLDQSELSAWYQAADLMILTPTTAGLNIIAKEYVVSRLDEQGSLILSKMSGCVEELQTGALIVDPNNADEISRAIASALTMSFEEKHRRMLAMRHIVSFHQLHDWAFSFLKQAVIF